MIKRIFAFILCIGFILTGLSVYAGNDVSVNIGFVEETIEINNEASLKIEVSGNVKKVTANIAYSIYFPTFSGDGIGFDIQTGEYTVTFIPSNEPFVLYCTAYRKGNAVLTLKNIVCETDEGSVNLGTDTAKITVTPKYTHIYTKEDLNNIRNNLSGAYMLMNDIQFTPEDFAEGGAFYNDGFGWIPIGAVIKQEEAFKGEFVGNGYTISGLTINKAYYNYCGLFGVNYGSITSLRIKDAVVDGRIGINMSMAASAPSVIGDIDYDDKEVWTPPDDSITEESLNNYDRTGESTANIGIVCGMNFGSIKECFVSGELYGNNSVGGIAGRNSYSISQCATNVAIGKAVVAGGIAGVTNTYSNITDCVSEGTIEASLSGGISGNTSGKVQRVYSLCTGNGLKACFGKISYETVSQAYAFGNPSEDEISEIKPLKQLSDHRFDGGEWTYGKEKPYPSALADLIKSVVPGDLNGDGEADAVDLALMKLFLAGLGEADKTAGDMNIDGKVDAADLAILKLKLAGLA